MSTGKRESDTGTAMEGKRGLGLLRSAGKNLVQGREVKPYVESLRAGESPVTASATLTRHVSHFPTVSKE